MQIKHIEIKDITLESQPTTSTTEASIWKTLLLQGVWKNNATLVQLLGLCPLLAVSNTATNALGLGLATMIVLICTNSIISLCRKIVPKEIRIPIYVMIIATTVTAVQLLMNAYTYPLYQALGIFIPLIVTNCIIIGRAEAYASKNTVMLAAFDGFAMGLGMLLTLVILGSLREIIGKGTLFTGLDQLLGSWAEHFHLTLFHTDSKFLLAILPPGAFLGLGILLALKNMIDHKKNRL
ncbi:electron transport complex subunit RsxE [Mergibacter septicus]|uniref:electron transport complex subunit E n=1 Tax=Mergibacter septicus TaxID=221402 RepID=UPI001C798D19|nr:electron transport complex subunit E [Mergibacter septicus]QDJ12854.1 electron transport complex subunit RsxE [Mergibacter septicus]